MSSPAEAPAPVLPDLAIGGRMQVGKTTCAEHLAARHGYVPYALAAPIKGIARASFGWDGRKDERGRRLLQGIGTVGRAYDPALWLHRFEAWLAARPPGPVVIDDLRLRQEARHLRRRGFRVILVTRAAVWGSAGGAGLHEHETEVEVERLEPDLVLANDGTIADLRDALDRLVAGWSEAARR